MTKIKERPEGFIVPIASDVGLKGALKTQDEFFKKLVSKLLDIPIQSIISGKFIDNEVINRTEGEPRKKVDLLFSTDNILINIEGNTYTSGILYRNNTYIYRIIIDDKLVFKNLKDKYYFQINFNTKPFDCNKKLINRFETREVTTYERLPFTPITIHVQLDYLEKEEYTKGIDPWLINALKLFTADSVEKYKALIGNDKLFGGVFKFMSNYSKDGKVLGEYNEEEDAEFIKNFDLAYAKEEGIVEGKAEGEKAGIMKSKLETARNMLKDKLDIKTISKYTSLTPNEINSIKL